MEIGNNRSGSLWSGVLLIAGTCIGAGMLAMPVVTSSMGFLPALFINGLCWLFMLATGLLFLEATLWMPDGSNVLSIAQHFLGRIGKVIGGGSFIFLYYSLLVGYFAAGEPLFLKIIGHVLHIPIDGFLGHSLFYLLFGTIVLLGTTIIDRTNWLLMTGLVIAYLGLVTVGSDEVDLSLLARSNWSITALAAPTLFSAYGYHNVIPSVSTYLKRDVHRLRWAVILGTTIPFVVYSFWQWLIIGSIPQAILEQTYTEGESVTTALLTLKNVTGSTWISWLGLYFSFFALVTSMLGVSLSMVDFFGDGFKMTRRTGWRRLGLCLLVFAPPFLFSSNRPGLFLDAMGYAGGFGEAILNGLFPIAIVWIGHYRFKLRRQVGLPGGKPLLVLLAGITVYVIFLELLHVLG